MSVVEEQMIGFGIAVVSEQASIAGILSIPTPVLDSPSSLWFVHKFMFSHQNGGAQIQQPAVVASIDSKAMRKVELGSDVVVVVEGASIGQGMTVVIGGRMLIKVH